MGVYTVLCAVDVVKSCYLTSKTILVRDNFVSILTKCNGFTKF